MVEEVEFRDSTDFDEAAGEIGAGIAEFEHAARELYGSALAAHDKRHHLFSVNLHSAFRFGITSKSDSL